MEEERNPQAELEKLLANPPKDGSRRGVSDRTYAQRLAAWQRAVDRLRQEIDGATA